MFQLVKCLEFLDAHIRKILQFPPFIPISITSATGKLLKLKSLYDCVEMKENLVILLEEADGNEEIPSNVAGIVLAHQIPQLSHLAIRARQAKILFVCFEQQGKSELDSLVRDAQKMAASNNGYIQLKLSKDLNSLKCVQPG